MLHLEIFRKAFMNVSAKDRRYLRRVTGHTREHSHEHLAVSQPKSVLQASMVAGKSTVDQRPICPQYGLYP